MRISLLQSLVGLSTTIKHLDGHSVEISRDAVTPPGHTQVLRGEGLPIHNEYEKFGNLVITYTINFPTNLTPTQKEGFIKLLS